MLVSDVKKLVDKQYKLVIFVNGSLYGSCWDIDKYDNDIVIDIFPLYEDTIAIAI